MVIEGHADARADLAARIRRKIAAYHERPDTWGAGYLLSRDEVDSEGAAPPPDPPDDDDDEPPKKVNRL